IKPLSDLTTPRRLICPISRHFFPVEQPEPVGCCTTGLKKGSRLPFIAHFFSSGCGGLGASPITLAAAAFSSAATLAVTGAACVAVGLGASILATAPGADAAAFLGTNASCGCAAQAAEQACSLPAVAAPVA